MGREDQGSQLSIGSAAPACLQFLEGLLVPSKPRGLGRIEGDWVDWATATLCTKWTKEDSRGLRAACGKSKKNPTKTLLPNEALVLETL